MILPGALPAWADAAWQRGQGAPVTADRCQELRILRRGSGVLELRLSTDAAPLPAVGYDPKVAGASIFIAAAARSASFVVHHTTGPYDLSLDLEGSIQWSTHGEQIVFASKGIPVLFATTAGEVRWAQPIALGAGWETAVFDCAPIAHPVTSWISSAAFGLLIAVLLIAHLRQGARISDFLVVPSTLALAGYGMLARFDPWMISPRSGLLAMTLLALVLAIFFLRCLRRRQVRRRVALLTLLLASGVWAATIPYPLRPSETARIAKQVAVPPLWTDAAYWGLGAPQQVFAFRSFDDDIAGIATSGEQTWLVIGGSVVAGYQVEASETFPKVAESLLRAEGVRIRILNAGVPGWNLGQLDRLLADVVERLPIRGVVVMSVLNNAAFPIRGEAGKPSRHTLLGGYAYNVRRNYVMFPALNFLRPKPGNLDAYRHVLNRLITREHALGRSLLILNETHVSELRPAFYSKWMYRRDMEYRTVAEKVCAQHNLALHPVVGAIAALPAEDQFIDGIHLTRSGHAAIGRELATLLRRRLAAQADR